jgi:4-hydroxybenzoyl-CoA thioesterase
MIVHERAVRFEEVDAAGIVFFGRFMEYCHEAMERFFDGVAGGYVDLITRRRIGFPAVHVGATWKAPLRYGDAMRIEVTVAKLGTTSSTFRYRFVRVRDGVECAVVEHVTVCSTLDTMQKLALPDDCRALLSSHLAT